MTKLNIALAFVAILNACNAMAFEWNYSKKIDEFNDSENHSAMVKANSGDGFAIARCKEKSKFDLYFSVGEFIGSKDVSGN